MTFSRAFTIQRGQSVMEAAAACDVSELTDRQRQLFAEGVRSVSQGQMVRNYDGLTNVSITGWDPAGPGSSCGLNVLVTAEWPTQSPVGPPAKSIRTIPKES